MINVSEAMMAAFKSDSHHKILTITFPDLNISMTNNQIVTESLMIKESIQSGDDLDFVGCCASIMEVEIKDTDVELVGQPVKVTMKVEGSTEVLPLFYGYVDSAKKQTAYNITKKITAYDPLKDILQMDVTNWYNSLSFPMMVKDLRNQFWSYVGYEQEDIYLINDSINVTKGLDGNSSISGQTIIEAICEFNGCFGIFNREGKWTYQYLNEITEGLYPEDSLLPDELLFPQGENADSELYASAQISKISFEDYTCRKINRVVILDKNGNKVGQSDSAGSTGNNVFLLANNFLAYNLTAEEAQEVSWRILNRIEPIYYAACDITARCSPWVECSDVLIFDTSVGAARSYVLTRTIKGVQLMMDTFGANGTEYRYTNLDSLTTKINNLQHDIDEEIKRSTGIEDGIRTDLSAEVNNRTNAVSAVQTNLNNTKTALENKISDTKNGLESTITQTASEIRTEVTDTKNGLESKISQTASEIKTEVSNTMSGYKSSIDQTAQSISATVEGQNGKIASIEATVSDQGSQIALKADQTWVTGQLNFDTLASNSKNWVPAYVQLKGEHSTYWAYVLIQAKQ